MFPNRQPRNVYIVGPQSTGKTSIVNELERILVDDHDGNQNAHQLRPAIIREVARTVLAAHGFTRNDITGLPDRAMRLQQLILEAQSRAEHEALEGSSPQLWFVSDRSGIDPVVYATLYIGRNAAQQLTSSDAWKAIVGRMKSGRVFLCEAGCSWLVDDGTRMMPKDREDWMRMSQGFHDALKALSIDYIIIPNDVTSLRSRVEIVLDAIRPDFEGSKCMEAQSSGQPIEASEDV